MRIVAPIPHSKMMVEILLQLEPLDRWVAACLGAVAVWIVASGLDDLFIDVAFLLARFRGRPAEPPPGPDRRVAIMVPLWREHAVIRGMIEHNVAAIRYRRYDVFLGVYPNDAATQRVARELESRFSNVHLALCPHAGPTSKADCLNWIYQRILLFEEERDARFDIFLMHDAEDLIHPESLRIASAQTEACAMVQIPVLPLPTPFRELTHGVYCDEFAEFQLKDLPVRQWLGGFVPSCGVGTAFSRRIFEQLADAYANRIFEPRSLTEDYENGFRIHRRGGKQRFLPLTGPGTAPMATREYFPRRFSAAVRQRTRWMMGIALQSWELHGWRETLAQGYWFWRDRKGLIGSLASPAANLLFLYGAATWAVARATGAAWGLESAARQPMLAIAFWATLAMQAVRTSVRMRCSARIYGWRFALGVPLRIPVGNAINCVASLWAIGRYGRARLHGEPLVWLKTDHAYPSRAALMEHKRRLGEILVGAAYITPETLESALASKPGTRRLGEHLVGRGELGERELYEALALQQNLELEPLEPARISRPVARALPAEVARKWKVLPFRISEGQLFLAGPELPTDEMHEDLRRFSRLEIRFQLVTPSEFAELERVLLE
ncbi:MAG: glycosyl transferase family protein, partial [Bryobacteraceae bacterium]